MFITGVEQLRNIEWGRDWLWDIKFPKAPGPFDTWFPASDVKYTTAIVRSKKFPGFARDYSIPEGSGEPGLSITFYDDKDQTLHDWLTFWMRSINTELTGYAATLDEALREVDIARLNPNRSNVLVGGTDYIDKFYVYPEGEMQFSGGSTNKAKIYTIDFVIAGSLNSENAKPYIKNMQQKGIITISGANGTDITINR